MKTTTDIITNSFSLENFGEYGEAGYFFVHFFFIKVFFIDPIDRSSPTNDSLAAYFLLYLSAIYNVMFF
ncbi:MAG: hypothetical protein LBE12_07405 [Planctomycetaceae bacterium]|jgi:hypothetical protein|nr:hypothetical protein [Planctomycetaceae bacterium]